MSTPSTLPLLLAANGLTSVYMWSGCGCDAGLVVSLCLGHSQVPDSPYPKLSDAPDSSRVSSRKLARRLASVWDCGVSQMECVRSAAAPAAQILSVGCSE